MPQKDEKYYIKDGIKCLKRDLKQNIKELGFNIHDLVASYWDLLKLKFKRN